MLPKLICFTFFLATYAVCQAYAGETCKQGSVSIFCEYGCCGSGADMKCCSISTSVLVVACVVSALVLIALVCAIVICCWKSYKDKQASRVRRIQLEEIMNAPRIPGVEPPKPPSYISAPPAYSEDMPESHFRPPTVSGQISYNQRFRGTTPVPRAPAHGSVQVTVRSGRNPITNSYSLRTTHIPGAVEIEAPPPYTEFARGRTPADRRRRFIQSPVSELNEEATEQTTQHSRADAMTGTLDTVSIVTTATGTPASVSRVNRTRDQQTLQTSLPRDQQILPAGRSRVPVSVDIASRTAASRSAMSQESRADSVVENEGRVRTVARVLGTHSRMSRIPTRVNGMQSRQPSEVQSRGSAGQTLSDHRSTNNRNRNFQEEGLANI